MGNYATLLALAVPAAVLLLSLLAATARGGGHVSETQELLVHYVLSESQRPRANYRIKRSRSRICRAGPCDEVPPATPLGDRTLLFRLAAEARRQAPPIKALRRTRKARALSGLSHTLQAGRATRGIVPRPLNAISVEKHGMAKRASPSPIEIASIAVGAMGLAAFLSCPGHYDWRSLIISLTMLSLVVTVSWTWPRVELG